MSALGPPGSSLRRAALLEQLVVALTTGSSPLAIRDRDPDDLTIALLDAWATAGDVIGFYLDRIADEGYISSATQPGSILALASLLGHSAQLGLAAATNIAYQLQPDPTDTAVVLPAALLCQSVPAVGQTAQTFETTEPLTARPSWGLLTPKLTRPLIDEDLAAPDPAIVIAGTTANLAPNQVLVLELVGGSAGAYTAPSQSSWTVAGTTIDLTANQTTVSLLPDPPMVPAPAKPGPPADLAPGSIETSADSMLEALSTTPPSPSSLTQLNRRPESVFGASSDATPRMIAALRPAVAPSLYQALATAPLLDVTTSASVCQVQATPFGAQAPPQQLFDGSGQPAGTRDWPIGGALTFAIQMDEAAFDALTGQGGGDVPITLSCAGRSQSADAVADLTLTDPAAPAVPAVFGDSLGEAALTLSWDTAPSDQKTLLTIAYTGGSDAAGAEFTLTATIEADNSDVLLTISDPSPAIETYTWDTSVPTAIETTVGRYGLVLEQVQVEQRAGMQTQSVLIAIEVPLPLANPDVLALDSVYPGIVAGTPVVIQRTYADGESEPAVVRNVVRVATRSVSAYGMTGKVTQLVLDQPWLNPPSDPAEDTNLTQSALREITVQAQATPLQLLPVPAFAPGASIGGSAIVLSTLVAGMEAGRLIAVTGQRADLLPATVAGGELAMVAALQDGVDVIPGDTPTTTLQLATPLTFSYVPATVQVYGNVVMGRQGATITDVLGSGNPAVAYPSFTLSSGPLLADPASTSVGSATTLTVTVDGVVYPEVDRLGSSAPARSYVTGTDPTGKTTITFAAPLPAGNGNVLASYRVGDGSQGNVAANQVTQMLSRPSAALSVTNPLPATGGAGGAQPEDVRSGAPIGMRGLGRLVSLSDFADLAQSWAGVAKATARHASDGTSEGVLVTVAGPDAAPLDPAICSSLAAAIMAASDPTIQVTVLPADLYMIVLAATVAHDPAVAWEAVAPAVEAALTQAFAYPNRALGEPVAVGDLVAAAHSVPSVRAFKTTALALVPATTTATGLATALPKLLAAGGVPTVLSAAQAARLWPAAAQTPATGAGRLVPDAVMFISGAVPDTLLLQEATP